MKKGGKRNLIKNVAFVYSPDSDIEICVKSESHTSSLEMLYDLNSQTKELKIQFR